ncbi:bcl-2-like protein 11 [Echeneis naucrates]|uniref:bcl-2-like protein 11 n=1 Tax=Echeneis naucrates TaxID=173247 RepID=UPI0011138008|nr:bcl-2-like protein 11 [Echeneis naucrates]
MQPPCRPPNRSDGTAAVTPAEESGGDPAAAGAPAQSPAPGDSGERSVGSTGGGEPESLPRFRTKAISSFDRLDVFQKRSIFSLPRRSSSGYISLDSDSLPSPPLSPRPATADRGTQTPSPPAQAVKHVLVRLAGAHGGGPGTQQLHESSPSPSSTQQRNAAGVMQAEAVGQELRRIGDEYNRLFELRGEARRRRHVVIHPYQLPHIHQEPVVLLCMSLLLLVIGRLVLFQDHTNSPSQV